MGKIVVNMTAGEPVRIDTDVWALLAEDDWHSGEYASQAFDAAWLRVRRHEDGRTLVYGYAGDGRGGGRPSRQDLYAGRLVAAEETATALREVAADLVGCACGPSVASLDAMVGRCLRQLPPRDL